MNAPYVPRRRPARAVVPLAVGDVVLLPDNAGRRPARPPPAGGPPAEPPRVKKHLRIVIGLDATHAYLVPIFTDRCELPKVCVLEPADMPKDVLDRRSFVAYDSASTRSIQELQDLVDLDRARRSKPCPAPTLERILAGVRSTRADLPNVVKRHFGLAAVGGNAARGLGR